MGRWLFLLGGLLVWAAHFLGVYGIASVADVVQDAEAPAALWFIAGFTALCAAADAAIAAAALRRLRRGGDSLDRFVHATAALAASISLVGVLWQGLPALLAA